jgi:hypothetical protein
MLVMLIAAGLVTHNILVSSLEPEERRHMLLIVAVTPEEEIANAGDEDRQVLEETGDSLHFGNRQTRTVLSSLPETA